jgi:nucleotide-binding universal stress UspA family protein
MFTRILVPLDGSPESNAALPLATAVAHATDGTIVLLRVLPSDDWTAELEADTRAKLRRVAVELAAHGKPVEWLVAIGDPADEILRQVRQTGADLVIMRTHGRAGLQRAVEGSFTEHVLVDCPVPVVMLKAGGHRVSRIRTLLVPVDGSPGGAAALGIAAKFARTTGAAIHVLQAVVPLAPFAAAYDGYMDYEPGVDDAALASARTYTERIVSQLQAAGLTVTGEARMLGQEPMNTAEAHRAIAATIAQAAEQHSADMIVMSTHGLVGLPRAVLGSVADAVVRTAACPVVLIRRGVSQTGSAPDGERRATSNQAQR